MLEQATLEMIVENGISSLIQIPEVSKVTMIKEFIRKNILGKLVAPHDNISWPKGCLLVGLLEQGETEVVKAYLDQWMKKGSPVYTVDDLLAGQALLDVVKAEKQQKEKESLLSLYKYEQALHKMMGFLYAHEKDELGSLPYRPLHKTNDIYADGIGMICPFACGYGVLYQDKEAVKLALKQIRNFVSYGLDEETGLPFHVYRYMGETDKFISHMERDGAQGDKGEVSVHKGLLGWGRAAGWIVYGLTTALAYLETDQKHFQDAYDEIKDVLVMLLSLLQGYSNQENLYSSNLMDQMEPTDTSASAMILYGMKYLVSIQQDETLLQSYQKGMVALEKYCVDGQVKQAQSECISLEQYGQYYASYPWSVGMAMKLFPKVEHSVKRV